MSAAFSSGADWTFPDDMPGAWSQEDVDAQLHHENETAHHRANNPRPTPTSKPASSSPNPEHAQQDPKRKHYPPRTCRICLEVVNPTFHNLDADSPQAMLPEALRPTPRVTYESPPGDGGRMLRPCKCKGSQKYVHEECLSAWRRQDPLQKRNYWQCPTCRYQYRLERLRWGAWISSTASQVGLTVSIFVVAMFILGFVADPIINLYLDPLSTIATAGGPTGSLIYDDEPATWTEHFVKGLASLGLLGFAKFLLTLSPWHWFNMRGTVVVNRSGGLGGTGRDRLQGLSWFAVILGIATFLWAVWKMVRAWSRRTLEQAGERVMDVPGQANDDEDD
ncbi:hypothetical protein KC351_g2584 [Hortaea werneckii]|nr:hypothetical protein KC351_g2584 [Hortaea werneckii]